MSIKKYISRKFVMAVGLLLSLTPLYAQTEMEYKMEIGGMLGGTFYMGDANFSQLYKNTNLAAGIVARYNINPRMAIKGNLNYGKISGDADKLRQLYGEIPGQDWKFSNALVDLSGTYELNFFGYGTGEGYKGNKRFTPYIQLGLGFTYCNKVFTANFPVGVGLKYKLRDRLNIGLDWTMHVSLSDKLDGISDPFKIESGFLKNTDVYSYTMLYISYDFLPRLRKCNND